MTAGPVPAGSGGDRPVAVVTDSTASLPPGVAVEVVALHVVLGRRTGREGQDVSSGDVALALRERRLEVSTSRPTPAELAAAYRATGSDRVVSVHLSAALSGTVAAARLAAREVLADGIEVRVVDSRTVAMGLGFAVLAAVDAAAAGRGLDEVAATAVATAGRTRLLFCVASLEHLRKGGRIGAAAALLGAALSVKPLLHVVDGALAPLERVRTTQRALARLVELAAEAAGPPGRCAGTAIAVHHLDSPQRAHELAALIAERLPGLGGLQVTEVGAVVGAHVGPGLVGVVVCPPALDPTGA